MIGQSEIKRIAATTGVALNVVEHDYALGCFLHMLASSEQVRSSWAFKGGTALAKCYFENYRFSEDLDFTITQSISLPEIASIVNASKARMQSEIGIATDVRDIVIDQIEDEYGKESYEAKIYYRGLLQAEGSPRSIRVHVNRDEVIFFPKNQRVIVHRYSDKEVLPKLTIPVYSLEEVLTEKLRAFSGQRRRAIARDVFDIYHIHKKVIDQTRISEAFRAKCRVKGIELADVQIDPVLKRREEFRVNWENNLRYLIPDSLSVPFDEAWGSAVEILQRVVTQNAK